MREKRTMNWIADWIFALVLVFGFMLGASDLSAATLIYLEDPATNSIRSGVGNLRGWAIGTEPIQEVSYAIDGVSMGTIPYGGTRHDVAAAYPAVPNSGQSGFSMAFNYGNLEPGEHAIEIQAGGESIQARFHAVGFEQPFVAGNPEVFPAEVSLGFYSVHLRGVWFPGEGERDLDLVWDTAAQQFLIQSNEPHEAILPPQDPCGFSPTASGC